jgi:tRNA-splicing endonuclease subunit Sen54
MLENARRAMRDALEEPRQIQVYVPSPILHTFYFILFMNLSDRVANSKRLSQGIWQPRFGTVRMLETKGAGFAHVGCSIRRPGGTEKKLELLPEEALYLVERGSLLCWEQIEGHGDQEEELEERKEDSSDPVQIIGAPFSVQQSFAVMIGKADLTLERYQVYAYLRRFGYVVRRSSLPDSVPEWSVYQHSPPQRAGILSWVLSKWTHLLNAVAAWRVNWWKPMCFGLLWGRDLNPSMHCIIEYECVITHRT